MFSPLGYHTPTKRVKYSPCHSEPDTPAQLQLPQQKLRENYRLIYLFPAVAALIPCSEPDCWVS